MVISFSKHFLTGDTVTLDSQYGTIEDISLTHTTIKLWDWQRYVVPNHRMLSKEVINHSHRQGYLMAWVAYVKITKKEVIKNACHIYVLRPYYPHVLF